jgi:hypothetical protein
MPITFVKDTKQTDVAILKYEGNWTVAEYEEAYDQMLDYAVESGRDIYLISNFLESGSVPPNVLTLAARSTRQLPDNVALIVTVNSSRFVTTLMDIAGKLNRDLGKKTVAVRSLEEAYTEIARRR